MKSITDYVHLEPQFYQAAFDEQTMELQDLLAFAQNKTIKSVVLFATGSSSNAAFAAQPLMSKVLQVPVYVEEPSIAANYLLHIQSDVLYIAISQGGHSYSIINLVEQFQQQNQPIWALTSDVDSPLAKISQHVWNMGMEKEEMPYVSVGYSVTILDLILLAIKLAAQKHSITQKEQEDYLEQIQQIIAKLPEVIEESSAWVSKNKDVFTHAKRMIFIGYGAAYGISREGETKITETVRITASGKELEEYMHGPYIGLDSKDCIIFLEPEGRLQSRAQALKKFLQKHVKDVFTIYANNATDSQDNDLKLHVSVDELLTSLFMTVPVHLLADWLSHESQIDLTVSAYPEFDQITESKV